MKYKVWGKAKAVLKPQKHHFEAVFVLAFIAILISAIIIAIRLGWLYSGTFYLGVTEPYLQSLSSSQVTIRWQSEQLVKASVELTDDTSKLINVFSEQSNRKVHEITITDLEPARRYYYRLLHDGKAFREGKQYWFETAPEKTSDKPVRLWLLGDPGRSGVAIESVKTAMQSWLDSNQRVSQSDLDMIISTGDSAYENGTNKEYQQNLFAVHQSLLRNYVFWPVYGNHDARGWSFFRLFTLPERAEAGGVASGTERYYSVEYGQLHLIFLDSNEGAYTRDDEMIKWLKQDLSQNQQKWTLVFMHHPPYTRGSHNSNDPRDSGNRMFNMRKRVIPVLESAGVDLVIAGHSHSYERSYLIDCHYGISSELKASSILQQGPVFTKPVAGLPHSGTLYIVLGASSEVIDASLNHPVMAVSKAELGSMVIDIEKNKLVGRYINHQSDIIDQFELRKTNNSQLIKQNVRSCQ